MVYPLNKISAYFRNRAYRKYCKISKTARIYPEAVLGKFFDGSEIITIGKNSCIRGELLPFTKEARISVGDFCYIGERTKLLVAKRIDIGNRVMIAHDVNIFDNLTHPIQATARHEHYKTILFSGHPENIDLSQKCVVVEDDVWIACQSIILPGIRIGKGAIVGAGSVVTDNVPPWTIVAGNPAKKIKKIEQKK